MNYSASKKVKVSHPETVTDHATNTSGRKHKRITFQVHRQCWHIKKMVTKN